MVGKLLEDLSIGELRTEMESAGIEGSFSDSLCLVKLTIHLVAEGEDPFTFQFQVGKAVHEEEDYMQEDVVKDVVNTVFESEHSRSTGLAVLGLTDGLSAKCSSESVFKPLSSFAASSLAWISSLSLHSSSRGLARMSLNCAKVSYKTFTFRLNQWIPDVSHYHKEYGALL